MGGQRRPLPFELSPRTNEKAAIRSGLGEEHSRLRAQTSLKAQGRNKLARFEEPEGGCCDSRDSVRSVWEGRLGPSHIGPHINKCGLLPLHFVQLPN